MKRQLLTASVVALAFASMPTSAAAEVNIYIGGNPNNLPISANSPISPSSILPDFIYIPKLGISVGLGNQWNMLKNDDDYYAYRDNYWYRSPGKNGPWRIVSENMVPWKIRRHSFSDIRRYRDDEYRRQARWFENAANRDFVYIPALGFSVPRENVRIVRYNGHYYAYRDNYWYRSPSKKGPWKIVRTKNVPRKIRECSWSEIKRYHEAEYNRRAWRDKEDWLRYKKYSKKRYKHDDDDDDDDDDD